MSESRNWWRIVVTLGLSAISISCAAQVGIRTDAAASAGPGLFVTLDELARAHAQAKQQPWAAAAEKELLRKADLFPQSYEEKFGLTSPELPPAGGQWDHFYACPDTGTPLEFHPPDRHVCPDNGKVYRGYPYDEVIYSYRADALGEAARNLALAYRLTGKRRYAEQGAALLKAYADRYLTYAIHDHYGTQRDVSARVYAQTLDEAIWLIGMAWAYDLLRGSDVLTAADRRHIEGDLLRPSAKLVSRAMAPTQNWQVWDDAALAAVGYVLDDQEMIGKAIDGPEGAVAMLHQSVVDGFWVEGSWGYQFYTMSALADLARMAVEHGRNLWTEQPLLLELFRSPVDVSFPNGDLAAFNDSVTKTLTVAAPLYEAAYSATKDSVFGSILKLSDRHSEEAFLYGVPSISGDGLTRATSHVFPHIGLARLSAPSSDLTEIVKFGPHGGVHGHFDELNEALYANGQLMSIDPGTQLYGVPSHGTWDKETIAHNTVVVDEKTQASATGTLLDWKVTPQYSTILMDAGSAYEKVRLTRRVVLTDRYVLEITSGTATDGHAHQFDWVYHNAGKQEISLPVKEWKGLPRTNGYQHLSHLASAVSDEAWQSHFHVAANSHAGPSELYVTMLGAKKTRVVMGEGLGPDLRIPVPFVLARRRAREAEFAVLMQPMAAKETAIRIEKLASGDYKISGPTWTDLVHAGSTISFEQMGER